MPILTDGEGTAIRVVGNNIYLDVDAINADMIDSSGASNGQAILADGSGGAAWGDVSAGASSLGDLTDVDTTGVSLSDAIYYDGASFSIIKNNVFVSGPTVNDDDTAGYTIGSRWYDYVADKEFVCLDYTTGSAVWLETTADTSELSQKLISSRSVTTNQTLDGDDLDTTIIVTSGSPTITLPDSLDDGFQCTILNVGSGTVDFTTSGSATATPSGLELDNTPSGVDLTIASLYHTTGGEWFIIGGQAQEEVIGVALSDEDTSITTGTGVATIRIPFAMTLTAVRASVNTAPTGSGITVDINEGGTTVLSTKLTIDATEKTSTTAATAAVISDASLVDDAEITFDIDAVGSTEGGKGLKVYLYGVRA